MEDEYQDEISLRELIEILLKRKDIIAGITITAIIFSFVISFILLSPKYESEVILLPGDVREENGEHINGVEGMLEEVSSYPRMKIETYREQIKTPEVILKTIDDLKLENYSMDKLKNSIKLEIVKDTNLLKVKVEGKDPEENAKIANAIANNFMELVSNNIKTKLSSASDYVKSQMEIEKDNYESLLKEQKEVLSRPRGSLEVESEFTAKLEQLSEYKTEINNLKVRQSALNNAKNSKLPGSGIIVSKTNGEKLILDNSNKIIELELLEVESSIKKIEELIDILSKDVEKLQIEFQEKSHIEQEIGQKVKLAQRNYEAFVSKYEELRVSESSTIGQSNITIVSKAYPNHTPTGPNKKLNIAISLVLGLMIGVFVAFFIEYWESTGEKSR